MIDAKCFSNEKLVAIIDKNLDIEEVEKMNCKLSTHLLVLILQKLNSG